MQKQLIATLCCLFSVFTETKASEKVVEVFNTSNHSCAGIQRTATKKGAPNVFKYSYFFDEGCCRQNPCCRSQLVNISELSSNVIYVPSQKACGSVRPAYYACSMSSYWTNIAPVDKREVKYYECTRNGWKRTD